MNTPSELALEIEQEQGKLGIGGILILIAGFALGAYGVWWLPTSASLRELSTVWAGAIILVMSGWAWLLIAGLYTVYQRLGSVGLLLAEVLEQQTKAVD